MEEKKDYRQQNVQKFYFNDNGQLVVETIECSEDENSEIKAGDYMHETY